MKPGATDHKKRHMELHASLSELIADMIMSGIHPDETSLQEAIEWSYLQTREPDHEKRHRG